ncbi:MAG: polyprenyl synthetase family protein [Chloroflexi bacterium]|nr:polyprenyl synthetase family protein [Chloroflexota bacterium]
MELPMAFLRYRSCIERELREILAPEDIPCRQLLHYHLGWMDEHGNPGPGFGGKALRPTLCLLACQAVGGDMEQALPAAAALELAHNFSLVHDDIQDGDSQRRHRPTLWYLWGKAQALNAGNALRILAGRALERLEGQGVPIPKRLQASRLLDRSILEMIEGQYLDLSYESRLDIATQAYLEMVERKTAALIGCSLHLGALLGGGDGTTAEAFCNAGRKLGLAFQIRDDILGIWGREESTGKPLGGDLRRRKKSYPVVLALEKATGTARDELLSLYASGSPLEETEIGCVLQLLEELRVREQAQDKARALKEEALIALGGQLCPPWDAELQDMATFLVERDY